MYGYIKYYLNKYTKLSMKKKDIIIKDSIINGKWIFANRDFSKWDIVLSWDISHILTDSEISSLENKDKKYISFIDNKYILMQSPEKYCNHSCNPNTMTNNFCDIAIRDIKKWEEITSDYSLGVPLGISIKCNCGAPNCKKTVNY